MATSTLYDPIMDALLALLQESCGSLFKTYTRRFVTWQQLIQSIENGNPALFQPALLLIDSVGFGGGTTKYEQQGRTPIRRTIQRSIVLYAQITRGNTPGGYDPNVVPGSMFYPLIESVESALEPSPSSSFAVVTLGGRVTHCWLEGEGIIIPGDLDPNGQGMATLPVSILIP